MGCAGLCAAPLLGAFHAGPVPHKPQESAVPVGSPEAPGGALARANVSDAATHGSLTDHASATLANRPCETRATCLLACLKSLCWTAKPAARQCNERTAGMQGFCWGALRSWRLRKQTTCRCQRHLSPWTSRGRMSATCKSNGVQWHCESAPGLAAIQQTSQISMTFIWPLARLPLIPLTQAAGSAEFAGGRCGYAAHRPHALQQCHRCT